MDDVHFKDFLEDDTLGFILFRFYIEEHKMNIIQYVLAVEREKTDFSFFVSSFFHIGS